MLKDYLEPNIYSAITKSFSFSTITEIRMRMNEKLIVVIGNKKYYLKDDNNEFIIVNKSTIDNFVARISENSLYAFNDNIINGFLTLPKGVRVGLSGKVVSDNDKIITIKDFQSSKIRIPHVLKNCSFPAYEYLIDDEIKNTLIISPPGCGKTTFLRDFIYQINEHNLPVNILIADERNEIASVVSGEPNIDLGGFCDIYTNCTKKFAFKNGIRSMNPDIIITDEIDLDNDINSILEAINSGVKVVATIHAKDLKDLRRKPNFDYILNEKMFSRFVVLSKDDGVGTLNNIYDEKLNCIYCRCV